MTALLDLKKPKTPWPLEELMINMTHMASRAALYRLHFVKYRGSPSDISKAEAAAEIALATSSAAHAVSLDPENEGGLMKMRDQFKLPDYKLRLAGLDWLADASEMAAMAAQSVYAVVNPIKARRGILFSSWLWWLLATIVGKFVALWSPSSRPSTPLFPMPQMDFYASGHIELVSDLVIKATIEAATFSQHVIDKAIAADKMTTFEFCFGIKPADRVTTVLHDLDDVVRIARAGKHAQVMAACARAVARIVANTHATLARRVARAADAAVAASTRACITRLEMMTAFGAAIDPVSYKATVGEGPEKYESLTKQLVGWITRFESFCSGPDRLDFDTIKDEYTNTLISLALSSAYQRSILGELFIRKDYKVEDVSSDTPSVSSSIA